MRALTMAALRIRNLLLAAALAVIGVALTRGMQPAAAATITLTECETNCSPTPTPAATPSTSSSPVPYPSPSPTPTGADSSGNSIGGLAGQRFNQMITNRVLGTVLLGVNEQVNCSDCISAFGSAGSFSAGIHGRKELTNNLSLLAGIAYTQYNEGGYKITSAPIGAFALRYDFTDWGSSRPFFDVGTILTPWEKARYTRSYDTSLGPVSVTSSTNASNYAVYGRAGWMSRVSPRDEVAASIEVWQLWQRVSGYSDSAVAFNPFDASIADGTDRTSLVKIGGQWTHLFGNNIETRRHRRHGDRQRHGGADHGQPGLVRIWRPPRLPRTEGLDRGPVRQRYAGPAAGRQHDSRRRGAAD